MVELVHANAVIEIRRILETAGYDTEEETGAFNLSAVRGRECLIVLCSDDLNLLQRFDMTPYTIMLSETKVRCDKLIFTGNAYFRPKEAEMWSRDQLEQYIARSAMARIYSEHFDLDEVAAAPAASAFSRSPVGSIPGASGDQLLPIRITDRDAVRIAHQEGPTVLRMIPYWYYQYVSSGEASYKGKMVSFDAEGSGWVNAINGLEADFGDVVPMAGTVPADADVMNPVNSKADTEEKVRSDLMQKLTKRVRIKTTAGDAIFAEEKEFKPAPEDIEVTVEKVYVPVWQVRGKKDIIEVNAYTGEELSVPSDEGCEVF
ncbi:hypothetical protein McpSp1_05520 [Methanocorpusculaceae archaeon Sp1]|uniref:Uncharacterized protein n=1 Tax=Methanorbis furvi TaxID=3028299 RepID=A0AAE4SAM7_9EURY|nr:hypothetical protein [Methanocorpusculaceae archaeon Sp1]MDV0442144.1 hypothetical protein [Methanocorpusculaceae archaeon Ag1]